MTDLSIQQLEKLSKQELINLMKRDKVRIMIISDVSLSPMTKFDTPEYKKFQHLRGVEITLSEAGRKYDIPLVTLSQWTKKGLINILGHDKNRLLLDEADVAYCAEVRRNNPGPGKRLFNPDGSPYTPKGCN